MFQNILLSFLLLFLLLLMLLFLLVEAFFFGVTLADMRSLRSKSQKLQWHSARTESFTLLRSRVKTLRGRLPKKDIRTCARQTTA